MGDDDPEKVAGNGDNGDLGATGSDVAVDAKRAKGRRTAQRGYVTRAARSVEETWVVLTTHLEEHAALTHSKVPRADAKFATLSTLLRSAVADVKDAMLMYDKRFELLEEAQRDYEDVLLMNAEEKDIEAEIEQASEYGKKIRSVRTSADVLLEQYCDINSVVPDIPDDARSQSETTEAKVPKIELPKFSGDVRAWMGWWEQFDVIVNSTDKADVIKFTYLRSLVTGEAAKAISGLSLSSAHYKVALDILKTRFGRPERIIYHHIDDLLNITPPKSVKEAPLWELYDKLQTHVRSLEALGISGKQYGVLLTPIILSRLPTELRLEWARTGEGKEGDLAYLLDFLKLEISRRERSQSVVKDDLNSNTKCDKKQGHMSGSAGALLAGSARSGQGAKDDNACLMCNL